MASGATVTPSANERVLKENLRKFVAAKMLLSWKLIFKKDRLGTRVVTAINESFVTVPPGFKECQLAELRVRTVHGLVFMDAEQTRAQTAARTRHLSK